MEHRAELTTVFESPNTGGPWESILVESKRVTLTDSDGASIVIDRDRARAIFAEAIRLLDEIELFEKGPINER